MIGHSTQRERDLRARDDLPCQQEDPQLWFPPAGYEGPAKRICGRCPAREMCLSVALETGQEAGVWGGKSPEERRAMGEGRTA